MTSSKIPSSDTSPTNDVVNQDSSSTALDEDIQQILAQLDILRERFYRYRAQLSKGASTDDEQYHSRYTVGKNAIEHSQEVLASLFTDLNRLEVNSKVDAVGNNKPDFEDEVDEAGWESFPASDPPSYNPGRA